MNKQSQKPNEHHAPVVAAVNILVSTLAGGYAAIIFAMLISRDYSLMAFAGTFVGVFVNSYISDIAGVRYRFRDGYTATRHAFIKKEREEFNRSLIKKKNFRLHLKERSIASFILAFIVYILFKISEFFS